MKKQNWLNIVTAAALLCAAPALAQEETAGTGPGEKPAAANIGVTVNKNTQEHTVSPDGCDFEITFPGEPYTARRCNPDNPDQCNRIISYTKVYNLDATVNFNVTCNPTEPGAFERYSAPVMKATLEAMLARNKLESFQTDAAENENFKQAVLVGQGEMNGEDHMYSAQLWISENSLFSVEGEVIGYAGPEADELFAKVMTSARYKHGAEPAENSEENAEEAAE